MHPNSPSRTEGIGNDSEDDYYIFSYTLHNLYALFEAQKRRYRGAGRYFSRRDVKRSLSNYVPDRDCSIDVHVCDSFSSSLLYYSTGLSTHSVDILVSYIHSIGDSILPSDDIVHGSDVTSVRTFDYSCDARVLILGDDSVISTCSYSTFVSSYGKEPNIFSFTLNSFGDKDSNIGDIDDRFVLYERYYLRVDDLLPVKDPNIVSVSGRDSKSCYLPRFECVKEPDKVCTKLGFVDKYLRSNLMGVESMRYV